jgi:hypothetical protein
MSTAEWHKPGRYEADGQTAIFVTDTGVLPDGMHGPWVYYRFPWETDAEAKPVLWTTFESLVNDVGYRRVSP